MKPTEVKTTGELTKAQREVLDLLWWRDKAVIEKDYNMINNLGHDVARHHHTTILSLERRGWIKIVRGTWWLTDAGRAALKDSAK